MAPFYIAVLGRFAWIDEVMFNIQVLALHIQRMQLGIKWIGALKIACVAIGKDSSIVRFDSFDLVREYLDDLIEEINGIDIRLFFVDFQISPSGSAINGRKLIIPLVINEFRNILHIYLDQVSFL
jgi:hypothetical protein